MYAIQTTKGLIIDSRPYGEAGKLLSIFTRDFGLVLATAQGIRLERSKLRYHAQEHSFGEYSLVRGKEFWRLTSASMTNGGGYGRLQSGKAKELMVRISVLLRRLLHGQESHPELYDIVESCHAFLEDSGDLSVEIALTLESVTVLRMLSALGYVGDEASLKDVLGSSRLTRDDIEAWSGKRLNMNKHINKALKESHL